MRALALLLGALLLCLSSTFTGAPSGFPADWFSLASQTQASLDYSAVHDHSPARAGISLRYSMANAQ